MISSLDNLFKVRQVVAEPRKLGPQSSTHMLWVVPCSPPPGSHFRRPERPACALIRQIISHLFPTDFLKPTPAAPTLHTPSTDNSGVLV